MAPAFEIGKHKIASRIVCSPKGQAKIDHDPFALTAVKIDVHANLVRPAKREEQQFVTGGRHAGNSNSNGAGCAGLGAYWARA